VSGRYVGQSGRPISAIVNGDINGDDVPNNDLAFVFDPSNPTTSADIAAPMRRVLDNPENRFRSYLRDNLGKIADRNGGWNPFWGTVDLRVSRDFPVARGQTLEVIADIYNFMNLAEQRLGWRIRRWQPGAPERPGFDQQNQRNVHQVNENFGVLQKSGSPYEIQLGGRWRF
jgi:hypothetical protein